MSSPEHNENLGYDPARLFVTDMVPTGEYRDDIAQQAAAQQRDQLLQEAIDASFTKRIATSLGANTGRGIGTAMGIGAWTLSGYVAGIASGVIYNWGGELAQSALPYIQPYSDIAGYYLSLVIKEIPPKPDTLTAFLIEEAKPKAGTVGEKVINFIINDASPTVGRAVLSMAEVIRDNVVSNLTSIGAVVGGAIGLERSSPFAEKVGRSVASPLVRSHLGFSRLLQPFKWQ